MRVRRRLPGVVGGSGAQGELQAARGLGLPLAASRAPQAPKNSKLSDARPDEFRTQRRNMPEIQNSVTRAAARQPSRFMGLPINAPEALARVKDFLEPPERCPCCGGAVELVSNEVFYKRVLGWPLTYRCMDCDARVGCHPGTDLPLGTLADEVTRRARRAAHVARRAPLSIRCGKEKGRRPVHAPTRRWPTHWACPKPTSHGWTRKSVPRWCKYAKQGSRFRDDGSLGLWSLGHFRLLQSLQDHLATHLLEHAQLLHLLWPGPCLALLPEIDGRAAHADQPPIVGR